MSSADCLILGAATGYTPEALAVFLNSLRNTGYTGTTALLVYDTDTNLIRWLEGRGVVPITTPPLHQPKNPFFSAKRISQVGRCLPSPLRRRLIDPLAIPHLHVSYLRFLCFNRYLRSQTRPYSHVFLTDTRDTAFQADPFLSLQRFGADLCLFEENPAIPLKEEEFNRSTVAAFYGNAGVHRIGHHTVLCAGTIGGGGDRIAQFLDRMGHEIIRKLKLFKKYSYGDQAILNWMARTGRLPQHRLIANFTGPAANLATTPSSLFHWNNQGQLLNTDGSIIPILHQYDRHPDLLPHIQKLAI